MIDSYKKQNSVPEKTKVLSLKTEKIVTNASTFHQRAIEFNEVIIQDLAQCIYMFLEVEKSPENYNKLEESLSVLCDIINEFNDSNMQVLYDSNICPDLFRLIHDYPREITHIFSKITKFTNQYDEILFENISTIYDMIKGDCPNQIAFNVIDISANLLPRNPKLMIPFFDVVKTYNISQSLAHFIFEIIPFSKYVDINAICNFILKIILSNEISIVKIGVKIVYECVASSLPEFIQFFREPNSVLSFESLIFSRDIRFVGAGYLVLKAIVSVLDHEILKQQYYVLGKAKEHLQLATIYIKRSALQYINEYVKKMHACIKDDLYNEISSLVKSENYFVSEEAINCLTTILLETKQKVTDFSILPYFLDHLNGSIQTAKNILIALNMIFDYSAIENKGKLFFNSLQDTNFDEILNIEEPELLDLASALIQKLNNYSY